MIAELTGSLIVHAIAGITTYYAVSALLSDPGVWWVSTNCAMWFLRDLYHA